MTDRAKTIIRAVAGECGLTEAEIMAPTHLRAVARPRQIAMALIRKLTKHSWHKIAERFPGSGEAGKKHHTTAIWAVRQCADHCALDPDFAALFERCEARSRAELARSTADVLDEQMNRVRAAMDEMQIRLDALEIRKRNLVSRETKIPLTAENLRDVVDLEIQGAIASGLPDPDICWALGVTGGQVTAMREEWEAGDA